MIDLKLSDTPDEQLAEWWKSAKETEIYGQRRRRELEDEIVKRAAMPVDFTGTMNAYDLKITFSQSTKIDADALQDLAWKHGLFDRLKELFRWKPELAKKAWEAATDDERAKLSGAITTVVGRPSFELKKAKNGTD